jgi:hypothetical protein
MRIVRLKVFFHYYVKVLVYNLELTSIGCLLLAGSSVLSTPGISIDAFDRIVALCAIMFIVPGNAFGIFIYNTFKGSEEYPFYYNCGFRIKRLIVWTISLNIAVVCVIVAVYFIVSRGLR